MISLRTGNTLTAKSDLILKSSFGQITSQNTLHSIRPVSAQVILLGKGRQDFASNVTLHPCEHSRQYHLVVTDLITIAIGIRFFFQIYAVRGCREDLLKKE